MEAPKLYKYQDEGVARIKELGRNVLLADPPGAGKSAQVVRAAVDLDARSILVVCPASLRLNWCREFELWAPGRYQCYPILKAELPLIFFAPAAVIISYDLASRPVLLEALKAYTPWDLLVLDEAHALRAPDSRRSRACLIDLWAAAKKRIAVTGTPVPNGRAAEAWPLFRQMAPEVFGSWDAYRDKYCGPPVQLGADRGGKVFYPTSKNLTDLGLLARKHFMIRRPREECLAELPPIVRQNVPLEVPRAEVLEAENDLPELDAAGILELFSEGGEDGQAIATVRRKLGELKAMPAAEFILELLDEEEKLVVFGHHIAVLSQIYSYLMAAGVYTRLTEGSCSADQRQKNVDDFQNEGPDSVRVFLGGITATATGITLTAASTVVFVESDWVPSTNTQAEGRIYRKGQKADILRAIYLVVPDSIDEAVTRSVARKQRDIEKVMAA